MQVPLFIEEGEVVKVDTRSGKSIRKYEVVAKMTQNMLGVAVGKAAHSSGYQDETLRPEHAVDGLLSTRWSSVFSDPQWLSIDLGREHLIEKVEIVWEAAFAQTYTIEVSSDGKTYQTVYSTDSGSGETDAIELEDPVKAQWIRMHGTQRGTPFGYSIYEFKVFGNPIAQ